MNICILLSLPYNWFLLARLRYCYKLAHAQMHNKDPRLFYFSKIALVYNRFDKALGGKHLVNNVDMCLKSFKFDKLATIQS